MPDFSSVTVRVPGTTANLGPGFDCLGAALNLYNQFRFSGLDSGEKSVQISVSGAEAERVATDEGNLVYRAFTAVYKQLGLAPPLVKIAIQLGFPLARGLGSSATAIVGGIVGANCLAGSPLERSSLMRLAIALEGHPDNVVPALLGGCRLAVSETETISDSEEDSSASDLDWTICEVPWHPDLIPIVAIPDFELSTEAARQVLPEMYRRADAVFNTARLGLLLRGLESGSKEWLRAALQDRIHQPYRQSLIPGYDAVRAAALAAGAYGLVISGAGPTLLTLTNTLRAESVAAAMETAWLQSGIKAEVRKLAIDSQGTSFSV